MKQETNEYVARPQSKFPWGRLQKYLINLIYFVF